MGIWREMRATAAAAVAALDVSLVPVGDAAKAVVDISALEAVLYAAKAQYAARAAEAGTSVPGERGPGGPPRTAADDLAARTGTSPSAANRMIETGKALQDHESLRNAAAAGELSPDQQAVIGDAAGPAPDSVDDLIGSAQDSTLAGLKQRAAAAKAAADPDPDATHRRAQEARRLRLWTEDQVGKLFGQSTSIDTAWIAAQLQPVMDELRVRARAAGHRPSDDQLRWDALLELVAAGTGTQAPTHPWEVPPADNDRDVETLWLPDQGGRQDAPCRTSAPGDRQSADSEHLHLEGERARAAVPARRRHWSRATTIIRVDATAMERGKAIVGELCEMAGTGPIPVRAVEQIVASGSRLALVATESDGSVQRVAHVRAGRVAALDLRDPAALAAELHRTGTDVAQLVHRGRRPTAAQVTALRFTSPTCTVDGCSTLACDIDHETGYAITQDTKLGDLDPLCRHHHRMKTLQGWALVRGRGKRAFVAPDDPRHPKHQ